MAFFNWEQRFEVCVESINSQHKQLVELINNLYDSIKTGNAKESTIPVLKELVKYTENHFADEEALMAKYGFPFLEVHKAEHETFVHKISDCLAKALLDKSSVSIEILQFLLKWLGSHIMGLDQQYSKYFIDKNIKI